ACVRKQRRNDLRRLLDTEVGGLLQHDLLVAAEIADAENVGLQRLDARQQRGEIGRAERVANITKVLDVEGLAHFQEAADHFVSIGVVRGKERDSFSELRKRIAAHGPGGQMRIQRLMERKPAEIGGLVNGIGLTDRIEYDTALFGNVVDSQLHG